MATSRPRGRQQVLQSTQSQSMREQRKSIVPVPTLNPCQLQLHVHPSRHCSYSQALSCTSCRVDTPRLSRRQSLPYLTQPRAQPTASWRSTLVRMCGYTNSQSVLLSPPSRLCTSNYSSSFSAEPGMSVPTAEGKGGTCRPSAQDNEHALHQLSRLRSHK